MFLIPYTTDAPIYYWPYMTVVLIVINVVVFVVAPPGLLGLNESVEPYVLVFGQGLHPVQWVTSAFLHAGYVHIIGNMFFLWTFGIIVEGKLGWYKFLGVYLLLAALQGAIVQCIMLGSVGCALGASGAIFSLMATSIIWAPESKAECLFLVGFIRCGTVEIKVLVLVGLYLVLQIVVAVLTHMHMSSEVLHLLGAAVGFPFGIAMVKLGLVNCENWDIFSVIAGRHTMSPAERNQADERRPERIKQRAEEAERQRQLAVEQIQHILQNGQPQFAWKAHERMVRELPDWSLPEPMLLAIIQGLHQKKLWAESIAPMVEYLGKYTQKAAAVRVKLAQILVVEQKRPAQALKVLAKIDQAALEPPQREFLKKLHAKACELHKQDPYEVADEEW
jgi:membrane associated rhomboid family serine protease